VDSTKYEEVVDLTKKSTSNFKLQLNVGKMPFGEGIVLWGQNVSRGCE
jgi:hypothetical protein